MGEEDMVVGPPRRMWGTWEELILGGAVRRHGNRDWDLVSSELRTRTVFPHCYTPEACKAKYEDLLRRYSGCKSWYEELRKRRVAELKRELEKSEESIGFLVSKLEMLRADKVHCNQIDYDSSQTESPPLPLPKTNGIKIKSSQKERLKNEFELSAGSFTQDIRTNPEPASESLSLGSFQKVEIKQEVPESCINKMSEMSNEKGGTCKKRRGKRKRKDSNWEVKEGSFVESENLGSASVVRWNDTSTSGCGQPVRSSSIDLQDGDSCRGCRSDDLVGIFNSVSENQYALVFRRRLDSQKRARYRKTIRQHMDLDTIRSRIANCTIKSARELFRDLLLVANNAIVFYSRRTREYKSAVALRDIVTKRYKQMCSDSSNVSCSSIRPLSSILCFSSMSSPPVKPRSIRPRPPSKQPKLVVKFPNSGGPGGPRGYLKLSNNSDSSTPMVMTKANPGIEGTSNKSILDLSSMISLPSLVKVKKNDAVNPKGCRKEKGQESNIEPQSLTNARKGLGRPRKAGGGGRSNNRQQQGQKQQQPKTLLPKDRKKGRQK